MGQLQGCDPHYAIAHRCSRLTIDKALLTSPVTQRMSLLRHKIFVEAVIVPEVLLYLGLDVSILIKYC
jgi:hypothetical protein